MSIFGGSQLGFYLLGTFFTWDLCLLVPIYGTNSVPSEKGPTWDPTWDFLPSRSSKSTGQICPVERSQLRLLGGEI